MNEQWFDNLLGGYQLEHLKLRLKQYLKTCDIYWVEARWYAQDVVIEKIGLQFRNPVWRKSLSFIQRLKVLEMLINEFIQKNESMTADLKKKK